MDRRQLLENLVTAAMGVGLLSACDFSVEQIESSIADQQMPDPDSLEKALQRMAMRDSTEQSTPMFLALENLDQPPTMNDYLPDKLNTELAAKFERYADQLLQVKSNPSESDVALLVELLAAGELMPGLLE